MVSPKQAQKEGGGRVLRIGYVFFVSLGVFLFVLGTFL